MREATPPSIINRVRLIDVGQSSQEKLRKIHLAGESQDLHARHFGML